MLRDLGTDERNARDIVHCIANHGLKVDDLVRSNAPHFLQLGGVEDFLFADVVNQHVIGDQLTAVFIAGHDDCTTARLFDLSGECRKHVVRFITDRIDHADTQQLQRFANQRNLPAKFVGHGVAVSLVLWIKFVAKGDF